MSWYDWSASSSVGMTSARVAGLGAGFDAGVGAAFAAAGAAFAAALSRRIVRWSTPVTLAICRAETPRALRSLAIALRSLRDMIE